jgi:predicted kinase
VLLVVSGLPGVGKTTVAAAVARSLDGVHVSVDVVEDALLRAGLPSGRATGVAAYEACAAVAEQNLELGRLVVADAVNDSDAARETWRRAARQAQARLHFAVLEPPTADEHRRRLVGRTRGLTHVPEPTWCEVRRRSAAYEAWTDAVLTLRASEDVPSLVAATVAHVRGR